MSKPKPHDYSLPSLLKSFRYAARGFVFALVTQRSMRLHMLAALLVLSMGLWLKISLQDWRWMVLAVALVWFAELVNTAVEYVCDVVMPDYHPSVEKAKDIAAGAVLCCTLAGQLIGILNLWPYLAIYL